MTEYLGRNVDLNVPETVEAYDEVSLWSAYFGMILLDRVPLRPAATVLDVGCGTGFPILELAGRLGPGAQLFGVDPWGAAVDRARRKAKVYGLANVQFFEGDAASLRFADQFFDLIVSNLGLNNFADPEAVLRECHRVLRRDGTIALTTNVTGHMQEFYEVFGSALRELGLTEVLFRLEEHIAHRSTAEAIVARLERIGFKVADVERRSFRLRYANGTALFNNYFVRLGFLPSWRDLVPERDRRRVFGKLEAMLSGEVSLTIPAVYIAATR
jgi:ubiquinone/menaquinone biosynthesis C-methylase UbiE